MPIPKIKPYPIPKTSELGSAKVRWQVDPKRAALLLHDLQYYFIAPFTADAPPLTELLANTVRLRNAAVKAGIPIFMTAQPADQSAADRGLLRDFWGEGLRGDVDRARILSTLEPTAQHTVIEKRRYSAFHGTSLLEELRARDRDQLIICGIYAHIGCLATAIDAFMFDVQPHLVADAVAAFTLADHLMALRYLNEVCGTVCETQQVLDRIGVAAAQRPSQHA